MHNRDYQQKVSNYPNILLDIKNRFNFLENKVMKYFMLSTFLSTLAYSIISPVESIYVSSFGINLFQLGLLFTISVVVKIVLDSPFGTLCDCLSRRKILTASIVVNAILFFCHTLANDFNSFLIIFILEGVVNAAYYISLWSYMNDAIKKTGVDYAAVSIVWMLPGMIGPYLGGVLGNIDNRLVFYAATFVEIAAVISSLFIPHLVKKDGTLADGIKEAIKGVYVDEFRSFSKANRNVKITTFFDGVLNYDGYIFYSFLPVYMDSFFGLNEFWIGIFFSAVELVAIAVRTIESFWFKKIIKKKLIIATALLSGLCYMLVPVAKNIEFFVTIMLAASFMSYILYPLTYHIFINSLPRQKKGEVVGMNQTLGDIGGALGDFMGGVVSDVSGVPFALFSSGVLYIVGAGLATFIQRSKIRQREVNIIEKDNRKIQEQNIKKVKEDALKIEKFLGIKR